MTEQDKEIAIQTIKDILHVLHEKRYAGTLDMNGFDAFDEYDVSCNFHPQYEYHHEVEFYEKSPRDLKQSMNLPLAENW